MRHRVLILATYFPDPSHPSRGNWALEQAQSFLESGHAVKVVVPTPWIPPSISCFSAKLAKINKVPRVYRYGNLEVHYPRWPYYPWHTFQRINRVYPDLLISLAWPFIVRRIHQVLDQLKPDLIIAYHTLVCGQVAFRINRRWGLPYVVTDQEIGDMLACQRNPRIRAVFKKVGQSARMMVGCSKAMEEAGRTGLKGVSFATIYNGSSFPLGPVERSRGTDRVRIFCCAKFYGRKDIPLLIRSCDALVGRGINLELRIAGDGPDREIIEGAVHAAKNREHIHLMGLISPEQVREEMLKADIFALVGWAEPFGVVFLEAMACGLPVVVCEDAGVAEVLEDGESAVFTRPMDQASVEQVIERLVKDEVLRSKIAVKGQEVYRERFTWEKINQEYLKLFEEDIQAPGNRPD